MELKIKKDDIKYFLLITITLLVFIRPKFFVILNSNAVYFFCGLQLVFVLLAILKQKSLIIDVFFILTCIYFIWCVINTILHKGAIPGTIQTSIWGICMVYILEYRTASDGVERFIQFSGYSMTTILWVNYILMLRFPDGLTSTNPRSYLTIAIHFLGQANQYTILLLFSAMLLCYRVFVLKNVSMVYTIFSSVVMILTVIRDSSASCKIAFFILISAIVTYSLFPRIVAFLVNPVKCILVTITAFLLLTKLLTWDVISDFIVNVVGKDITLSERTTIWTGVYEKLSNIFTLVFGLGEVPGGAYITIYTGNTFSAHNIILQICLSGGLVLLSVFAGIIGVTVKKISSIREKKIQAIISICLFVFCIVNMTEVFELPIVLMFTYFLYVSGKGISQRKICKH